MLASEYIATGKTKNPFENLKKNDSQILSGSEIKTITQDYRLTPATLKAFVDPTWIPTPHLKLISSKVAAAINKGGGRIMVSLPPRHGKSELLSVGVPLWILENFSNKRVIISAYGADLSVGFGKKVRDTIISHPSAFNVAISKKSSKVASFETTNGSSVTSVGVGGAITGRGADIFLIDDYFKGPDDAFSPAQRDNLWEWFQTVAMTRLEPGATMIILATRWHSDGLIGRIQKQLDGWEYIEIPAIANHAEGLDMLGRAVGDPLFPERYSIDYLLEQQKVLGTNFFNALYQQTPIDESTKFTEVGWLKPTNYLPPDEELRYIRVWDLAGTEDGGDWTVGNLMAMSKKSNCAYIVDIVRKQLSPHAVELLVMNTAKQDGVGVPIIIERDPGQAGKSQVDYYSKTILPDYEVVGMPVNKKKVLRAQPFIAAAEANRVYLYYPAGNISDSWQEKFKREFAVFPGGKNDDMIDTSSTGFRYLETQRPSNVAWGRVKNPGGSTTKNVSYHESYLNQASTHQVDTKYKSSIVFGR